MTKAEKIAEFLSQPIAVGDRVSYNGDGNGSKSQKNYVFGTVVAIDDDDITIDGYDNYIIKRKVGEVKRSIKHLGANPFRPELRMNSFKIRIDSTYFRKKNIIYYYQMPNLRITGVKKIW